MKRSALTLIVLVASAFAHADEKPDGTPGVAKPLTWDQPLPADSPSPWACDTDTLVSGKRCHFDALAKPRAVDDPAAQHKKNDDALGALVRSVCTQVALSPDAALVADVQSMCSERMSAVAKSCGKDDAHALVDDRGRFAPSAKACYGALRAGVDAVKQATDAWAPCCHCLAAAKCAASFSGCALGFADGKKPTIARPCIEATCADDCRAAGMLLFPPTANAPVGPATTKSTSATDL
ncbi:MAG TPA: hypothetical protein VGO62_01985 [Myxococcota bacterium]